MKVTVKVEGLADLNRRLTELPKAIQGRPLRTAVAAGGRVIQQEAKARVPVDTGLVRDRIRVMSMRQEQRNARAEVVVGVRRVGKVSKKVQKNRRRTDPFYWRFIEFGTKFKPARPFLRPALENKRTEAVEAIRERLAKRIEIEAQKLGRR